MNDNKKSVRATQRWLEDDIDPSAITVKQVRRNLFIQGGRGSGHHGHSGRPGLVGGSTSGKGGRTLKVVLYGGDAIEYEVPRYLYHVTTKSTADILYKQGFSGGRRNYFTGNPENMMFADEELNERLGDEDLYVLRIDTTKIKNSAGWKFDPEWYPSSSNAAEVVERLNSGQEDLYIYTSNSVPIGAIDKMELFRKRRS